MAIKNFDDDKPLFIQIKELIEEQIIQDVLKEEEQIPSTTQLVAQYKINHITVSKGITILVDQGIIYKKRGVGMFVATGAKDKLRQQRVSDFSDNFIKPLAAEAKNLDIGKEKIFSMIDEEF